MLFESIKMSWENIINNKLSSFLTMLGIVIGVASIIALVPLFKVQQTVLVIKLVPLE